MVDGDIRGSISRKDAGGLEIGNGECGEMEEKMKIMNIEQNFHVKLKNR